MEYGNEANYPLQYQTAYFAVQQTTATAVLHGAGGAAPADEKSFHLAMAILQNPAIVRAMLLDLKDTFALTSRFQMHNERAELRSAGTANRGQGDQW